MVIFYDIKKLLSLCYYVVKMNSENIKTLKLQVWFMKAVFSGKDFPRFFMSSEFPYIYSGMKIHCTRQVAVKIPQQQTG